MVPRDKKDGTTFVIVGGGAAALSCAETLRQEGFKGQLVMVAKENALPYDRIKLSKMLDATPEKLLLRPANFYKEHDIEVMLRTEVVSLNPKDKVVHLSSGSELKYNSIFLASGSYPRPVTIPGNHLQNVFILRNVDQANEISKQLSPEKHVVILGASFIGMECAAYCAGKAKSVTVVGRSKVPFKPVLGEEVGGRVMALFEEKGIEFKMGVDIIQLLPSADGNTVGHAELSNESMIPADIVIAGIGSIPNTQYLDKSDFLLADDGTVPVNENLETNVKGVYAGGDIAYAPVFNTKASIGHWQLAQYHGHVAGLNMAGRTTELKAVPFFWTMVFGKSIRYAGYAAAFDNVIISGNLAELEFVAYYCQGKDVAAVAACSKEPIVAKFADLLSSGHKLTQSEVEKDATAWYK